MTTDQEVAVLKAEVRRLKRWGAVGGLVLLLVSSAAFLPRQTARFTAIEAQRIDIVHPDGRPALVLAGSGHPPGPMMDGKQYPQEVSGGRTTAAGMIFFNGSGDEVGGLIFHGARVDDGYSALGHLSFDQWKQDQVVALQYQDNGERRSAGLNVWDRSTNSSIAELLDLSAARARAATAAERDSLERAMQELASQGDPSVHRVFLGSADRTAGLFIRDTSGNPRLRVVVDATDVARIEFLETDGRVVRSFPE